MTRYFTAADGIRIAYRDEGRGLPLLCLPGLTRSMTDFDYLAPHLPAETRMIRMDYRGRGRSDWADPSTYAVPVEARDALALMDHLGIDRFAVLGTSRGGLIAHILAVTARHRLLGVALNDIGPDVAAAGLDKIADYIGRHPRFSTHAELAAALPALNPGFDRVAPARWLEDVTRHYDASPMGLRVNYDPRLRDAVLAVMAQPTPDLWPLFDAFQGSPLCLIRGANSDLLTPETTAEMRRRRPDMHFAEVPGIGHIPHLDEPESLAALTAFLEDCR